MTKIAEEMDKIDTGLDLAENGARELEQAAKAPRATKLAVLTQQITRNCVQNIFFNFLNPKL